MDFLGRLPWKNKQKIRERIREQMHDLQGKLTKIPLTEYSALRKHILEQRPPLPTPNVNFINAVVSASLRACHLLVSFHISQNLGRYYTKSTTIEERHGETHLLLHLELPLPKPTCSIANLCIAARLVSSRVAPANQTKERSGTFRRDIPEQKFNVNRACFPEEKHQKSQKWAKFMSFSFWPFLWFGLPGRLLISNCFFFLSPGETPWVDSACADCPWYSRPGWCWCPGSQLHPGGSDSAPALAFASWRLQANAWICCPQLPDHLCKNGTHSTSFSNTRGHIPTEEAQFGKGGSSLGTIHSATEQMSLSTVQEPPTRTTCLKGTGSTPPICTAVRPPICNTVPRWLPSLEESLQRETPQYALPPPICTGSTPPTCTGSTFEKIPGVGGSGNFLSHTTAHNPRHRLGMRLPLTGAKIPKIGKRGFRSQKTPISHHPRKKGAPRILAPVRGKRIPKTQMTSQSLQMSVPPPPPQTKQLRSGKA